MGKWLDLARSFDAETEPIVTIVTIVRENREQKSGNLGQPANPYPRDNSANSDNRSSITQSVAEYHERVRRRIEPVLAYSFAVDTACKSLSARTAGRCANCENIPTKALLLMDGATVCLEQLDCLIAYGTRRKLQGVNLLLSAGLPPPSGWTLPDGSKPPAKTERK